MKKFRKLIPALCMLLISAMLMGTSTYAWFSMNTTVTATGMKVQAVAEDGIVISNSATGSWTNSANSITTDTVSLVPTTQKVAVPTAWYHAKSTNADNAEAGQAAENYSALTIAYSVPTAGAKPAEGVGYVNGSVAGYTPADDTAYFLLSNFYIKSSGSVLEHQDLYINDVTVVGATNKIDCSLRVLVVVGSNAYLYAPVSAADATPTYTYKYLHDTDVTANAATVYDTKCLDAGTIGNTDVTAQLVQIYIYFEGEDANCKSTNISGISTTELTVTVNFGTTPIHG